MDFLFGNWSVLDAFRDHVKLTRLKNDVSVPKFDAQRSLQNKEEIIRVIMVMPVELTFSLDDHDIAFIELRYDFWAPAV